MSLIAVFNRMPLKYALLSSYIKTVFETLNGREIQQLVPDARQAYGGWIKKKAKNNTNPAHANRIVNDIQPLDSGRDSAILWLGDRRKAQKVVLFLHGGGYVIPLSPGHIEWAWNAYVLAGAESGVETAVAILQYTLAPGGQYPVQLQQAVAAYQEIRAAGYEPQDIIIGGDSAGGNLTMQLVSHMLHPNVAVKPINIEQPLNAIFLVSPWLSHDATSKSFKANNSRDMVSIKAIGKITKEAASLQDIRRCFTGDNGWMTPLQASSDWLSGIDKITNNMYICVGGQEVLADHGRSLLPLVKQHAPDMRLVFEEGPKEVHDVLVLEGMGETVGQATLRMRSWFKTVLASS